MRTSELSMLGGPLPPCSCVLAPECGGGEGDAYRASVTQGTAAHTPQAYGDQQGCVSRRLSGKNMAGNRTTMHHIYHFHFKIPWDGGTSYYISRAKTVQSMPGLKGAGSVSLSCSISQAREMRNQRQQGAAPRSPASSSGPSSFVKSFLRFLNVEEVRRSWRESR